VATSPVRNLIKEGKTHQLRNVLLTGARDGMVTLEQSLTTLVRDGVIRYEDAVLRSSNAGDIGSAVRLSGSAA